MIGKQYINGERKGLPYSRIPINRGRRNNINRKSSFGKHHTFLSSKIHQWMLKLVYDEKLAWQKKVFTISQSNSLQNN